MSAYVNFYICIPFLCTPKFHTKAPTDRRASESKFKAHWPDRAVCPSCMHTPCNSMDFVKAAAVYSTSKKQKYTISNEPFVLYILWYTLYQKWQYFWIVCDIQRKIFGLTGGNPSQMDNSMHINGLTSTVVNLFVSHRSPFCLPVTAGAPSVVILHSFVSVQCH